MKSEVIQSDVLCVGGGIAGLMAAIRARELGAKVVIAEKGNAIASGSARGGNDHFQCYIPEVHGPDIKPYVQQLQSHRGQIRDRTLAQAWAEKSFDIVNLWDSWGIPMKYEGKYEFAGHGYPGFKLDHLKYSGIRQKPILVQEAIKRGVEIVNRVMVFDLLCNNGSVVGAIGVSTREDKLVIFLAKHVVLGTGFITRLYPSPIHGRISNPNFPPTVTGDGRAMAYRAGAELVGLDMPYRHCGPKYFGRSGQATWVGVIRDGQGKQVGPYVSKPDKKYGDAVLETYPNLFEDVAARGNAPVYMDCTGISAEDYDYMMHFMNQEGNGSFLNHLEEEGIDLKVNPIEFMRYEIRVLGGLYYDERAETSLKGLYAAGDELFGGISNAAVFGWIAGENAALGAKEKKQAQLDDLQPFIEKKKQLLEEIRSRKAGTDWKDANMALQQIMNDHAGSIRSETQLNAGLNSLRRLRKKVDATVVARNQWELIRYLETLNLFDMGELVITAARERKETRGKHIRPDYPVTDPRLDKSRLFIKKVNDKIVTEWRPIKT
jgi:succinate dehydrogenase/fumarate reductase flavoprotein subunit